MYLDVSNKLRKGKKPTSTQSGAFYRNAPALYYEPRYSGNALRSISYWFFFPFNNRAKDKHEGDWEHVVVQVDGNGDATNIAYYTHNCPPYKYSWNGARMRESVFDDTHPRVYIALHGHGAWRTTGWTFLTCPKKRDSFKKGVFDRRDRGVEWWPWVTGLRNARTQSWYGLGVGWGKEGGLGWGPVGPGRYKEGAIPSGW